MYFLPSQSVNDLRYYDGTGMLVSTFMKDLTPVSDFIISPSKAVDTITHSPSAITWTAPTPD